MVITWRYIETGHRTAAENMAIDEAIMRLHPQIGKPTLRVYGWRPPAVSIGYFQSLEDEINLAKCRELHVDYVRRITGGGAVFHDTELTYSLVISEDDKHASIPKNILGSYGSICGAIVKGLSHLGLQCQFVPLNDIILNGKKISGNAQTRRGGVILQHGTIILDVDVDKMFSILKVPNEKIRDKMISSVKERVTSIRHEAGSAGFPDVACAIRSGFEEQFSVHFVKEDLTHEEMALAARIQKEKFGTDEWNRRR